MKFNDPIQLSQDFNIQFNQIKLQSLSKQLKDAIKKAKQLANSCKINKYQQSQYQTTAQGQLILPQYKQQISYNQQFWKKYLKNQINFVMIKDVSQKIAQLQHQVYNIDKMNQQYQKICKIKNRKKNRRLDIQIQKKYQCPYQNCYRVYGSDVSLNLHIKLKHGGGNKTDRQKLAKEICQAQEKGLPLPQLKFKLPKQYLQQYKISRKQICCKDQQNWMIKQSVK